MYISRDAHAQRFVCNEVIVIPFEEFEHLNVGIIECKYVKCVRFWSSRMA